MGGYYGGRSGYYGDRGSGFYESAYDPDKYMQMIGINLGFGKRLSWPDDYFYTMLTLNYQLYSLKNWDRYFLIKDGVCHKISVDLSLQRSSVDNPLYTRYGSQFVASVSLTPPYSLSTQIGRASCRERV